MSRLIVVGERIRTRKTAQTKIFTEFLIFRVVRWRTASDDRTGARVLIAKQRMRSERLWRLLFVSPHFRGFIEIFLAAIIASNSETLVDGGARHDGICLGKWDSMPKEKVLSKMKPMVLAQHHPAITAILPHATSPSHYYGWAGNQR